MIYDNILCFYGIFSKKPTWPSGFIPFFAVTFPTCRLEDDFRVEAALSDERGEFSRIRRWCKAHILRADVGRRPTVVQGHVAGVGSKGK